MTQFEVLSNKAREQYRPPLWVRPASADLLLKFGLKKKTPNPQQPVQRASRLGASGTNQPAPGKPQLTQGQPAKPQPDPRQQPARPSASQAGANSWQRQPQNSTQKPAAPSGTGRPQENDSRSQPSQSHNPAPASGRYRSERSGMPPARQSMFGESGKTRAQNGAGSQNNAASQNRNGSGTQNGIGPQKGPVSQNGKAPNGVGGARSTGSTNPVTRFNASSASGGANGLAPRQNGSGSGSSKEPPKLIPNRPAQPRRDERFSRDPQSSRGQPPHSPEQPRRIPQLPIKPKPDLPKTGMRSNTDLDLDTDVPVQVPLAPPDQPRQQPGQKENLNGAPVPPVKPEAEGPEKFNEERPKSPGLNGSASSPSAAESSLRDDKGRRADYSPRPPDARPSPRMEEKPQEKPKTQPPAPLPNAEGLERLLESHPGLPNETAVLGVCDDGLPVLLDLNDPTPGSLLLVGDEREKHLDMLRSAVSSTVKRNSPRAMQFLVITDDPQNWDEWIFSQGYERHCLGVEDRESEAARQWILQLADWTEQRRLGQRGGPPVLVLFDTLDFLPRLPYDVRLNFDWMVKEAPPARIWPVASISTNLALSIGSRMLRSFQSRVLGYACDAAVYTRLGGLDDTDADDFVRPGEFAVKVGDEWLRFQAPGRKT